MELSISSYNRLASDEVLQDEATESLKKIEIMLNASAKFRALARPFVANYAIVVSWKNTVPNPAFLYQYREVLLFLIAIKF